MTNIIIPTERQCRKCHQIKPIQLFNKHKKYRFGITHTCNECWALIVKNNYHKLKHNHESQLKRKSRRKKSTSNYRKKYPEKLKAGCKMRLFNKLNGSRIKNKEYHHWSYHEKHWLDCIILDYKEHAILHTKLIYENESMMYKRKDNGVLLDTRKKHEQFIKELNLNIF